MNKVRNGFSLLELSIVLVVIGIILSMGLDISSSMIEKANRDKTKKILSDIEAAMVGYYKTYGHLPCPASSTDGLSDPNFGKSTVACNSSSPAAGTVDVNSESPEVTPTKEIRIGTIPVRDMSLPTTYMFDAWGNRITYSVIKDLAVDASTYINYPKGIDGILGNADDGAPDTDSNGAGDTTGIIKMQDKAGSQITYSDKRITTPYVLVSHGRNGMGAYNRFGGLAVACSGSTPEKKNCDNDSTFVDELLFDVSGSADYFDDFVRWKTKDRFESDAAESVVSTGGATLPTCQEGEILKYTSGAWACKADEGTFLGTSLYNSGDVNFTIAANTTQNADYSIVAGSKFISAASYTDSAVAAAGQYCTSVVGRLLDSNNVILYTQTIVSSCTGGDITQASGATASIFIPVIKGATTFRIEKSNSGGSAGPSSTRAGYYYLIMYK
jgi:prepilin-type N-terminal cleavage/methylation domain-containing protein